LTVVVLRGLRTWRSFRSFGRSATAALDEVARAGAATEARAAAIPERTERLQQSVERLQDSLERLAILRAATGDLRRGIRSARGAVPRK
jgi:MoxR-like ATPase